MDAPKVENDELSADDAGNNNDAVGFETHAYPETNKVNASVSAKSNEFDHYHFHCGKCDKSIDKIHGVRHCSDCQSLLEYACDNCEKQYRSIHGIYNHIKNHICTAANKNVAIDGSADDQIGNVEEYVQTYCLKYKEMNASKTAKKRDKWASCHEQLVYRCACCMKSPCNIEPRFQCSSCDYSAKSKEKLTNHVRTEHAVKKCSGCDKTFANNRSLTTHRLTECKNFPQAKCTFCSFKCNFNTELKNHIRSKHNARHVCVCGKNFKHFITLKRHKVICRRVEFKCDHCEYTVCEKALLTKHLKNQHTDAYASPQQLFYDD
ncbi:zinc finger Y-chromosomal protein 1-like [Phymastichus coffea]|uniref:zinc finger Y-chromosomal protein 1-like n=1 Tax=Phymastichus coffea TaxID=108790 RepID=UPI00273C4CC0|nr:zinc finger Y-chromosomal protein 1-like [Phymastichus coffea]